MITKAEPEPIKMRTQRKKVPRRVPVYPTEKIPPPIPTPPGTVPYSSSPSIPSPPPPTSEPELTPSQFFTKRIAEIYQGKRSKPEDLYEPLSSLDRKFGIRVIGIITDELTRELYSFRVELQEKIRQISFPKKSEDLEAFDLLQKEIEEQCKAVENLLCIHMMAVIPGYDPVNRDSSLSKGWVLSEKISYCACGPDSMSGLRSILLGPGLQEMLEANEMEYGPDA